MNSVLPPTHRAHAFAPDTIEVHRVQRLLRAPLTWFCAGLLAGQISVAVMLLTKWGSP